MTGPEIRNEAHAQGSGTVFQAGEIHGDARLGNVIDRSRSTTVSLGAFGVIAGVVMTLLAGFAVWKLVQTDGSPVTAPDGTVTTTSSRATTPVSGSRAKEVRLTRGTGVDVDGDDPKATGGDGANGEADLYLDRTNLLYANGSGFFTDRGHEQKAQERCTEAVAGGENTDPSIFPAVPGTQYCFETSTGQVGWIRVKNSTLSSFDSDASAVLAVQVWQR
ncbi:hypothetical protein [Lentzea californiensis]|uniref:hypothetical protein n=1 Tax=Lentzea californiensis TaxID=438851 RepID=UPI0021662BB9|nr:hypothetical protein [Lentzea californiensis]MCR3751802.1 hypothetical protein [Lentzea californiensis]